MVETTMLPAPGFPVPAGVIAILPDLQSGVLHGLGDAAQGLSNETWHHQRLRLRVCRHQQADLGS